MKRVTGIGGVFFKAKDRVKLREWYQKHLGLPTESDGSVMFPWREASEKGQEGCTVWEPFAADTEYFAPSTAPFMINYRVADLGALLTALRDEGVAVEETVAEESYGRFAWLMDPEGNRIELWEPLVPQAAETAAASPMVFENRNLSGTTFRDVALAGATFEDVNLGEASFHNISLRGARFSDMNLAGVVIEDANIDGLTINGFDVLALIRAEQTR